MSMKLRTLVPLYLACRTVSEGTVFSTDEQHGRDLLKSKFAEAYEGDDKSVVTVNNPVPVPGALTSSMVDLSDYAGRDPLNPGQHPARTGFKPVHKGGGKWVVVDAEGVEVFSGDKAEAKAEADRLNAGGELKQAGDTPPADQPPADQPPADEPPADQPPADKAPETPPQE